MGQSKKVLSNIAWMVFDKIFMLLLNLFVSVKVANHFGSMGYGTYQYAVSMVAIFELLVAFVDGRVLKKRYINTDADALMCTATISRVFFSAVSFVIGILFLFIYDGGEQFGIIFVVLLLNAILSNLRFAMTNRFEYLLKSKKVVIAADIAALLGSLMQLCAVAMKLSIEYIAYIAAIASFVNFAIIVIQYKLEFKKVPIFSLKYFSKDVFIDMLKESTPLAIAASCTIVYTRCDSVMIGAMLTAAEVGVYAIALKLVNITQIAMMPIRDSVYPALLRAYNEDKEKYAKMYVGISGAMTWLCIAGVLVSFVILPYIFNFLNDEYSAAFSVYQLLCIQTLFVYNAALRAGHFTLINKGSILLYSQIIAVIANVIMNYVGISLWGMHGAAMATVVTQVVTTMISNLFFGKEGREVFVWQLKAFNPVSVLMGIKELKKGK